MPRIPHPSSFSFPSWEVSTEGYWGIVGESADFRTTLQLDTLSPYVHRLRARGPCWGLHHSPITPSQVNAFSPQIGAGPTQLQLDPDGVLRLCADSGAPLLEGDGISWLGMQGSAWVLCLRAHPEWHYHGLGERGDPFDLAGRRFLCRNVDVWGEVGIAGARDGNPDPLYLNIPWVIMGCDEQWVGIWVNHPGQVFFSLSPDMRLHPSQDAVPGGSLYLGAPEGEPEVFFFSGNSPQALAAQLQRCLGVFPRPPLWALGHHQCRWGYGSVAQLQELDREYAARGIPCDGLWLDIDYMDRYRVFTLHPERMDGCAQELASLRLAGRKILAILDPGVADAADFPLRNEGLQRGLFCSTEEGVPFRGFVWPGATLYPDFFLEDTRQWWADQVEALAAVGFDGFWLDMNDPSTGSVDPGALRFLKGRVPHDCLHNAYANAMAQATRQGLLALRPNERPFLLTRSGWAGIGSLSAVWMGDNFSTWEHLRRSIPMALNLSLSGVPMVGADASGFGGNADSDLMVAWYRAHFLFPFLRNHCVKDAIAQEPWAQGPQVESALRELIVWRYRLLPYLYQQFLQHEVSGEPILRSLHGRQAPPGVDWSGVDDQFFVGPYWLQAPLLAEGCRSRTVHLPGGLWFDLCTGQWQMGPSTQEIQVRPGATPVWIAAGAVLPLYPHSVQSTAEMDLALAEFHLFLPPSALPQQVAWEYTWDDGHSLDYRSANPKRARFAVHWGGEESHSGVNSVRIKIQELPGELEQAVFVVHGLDADNSSAPLWDFLGCTHPVRRISPGVRPEEPYPLY